MARAMRHSGISWIGEIPEKWKVVRTKNVLECGKEIVGAQSSNTQLLSLTTKGIKQVDIGSTSGKVPDSYDTYQVVHPGNMVFCLFDLDCSAVFSGVSQYDGMISPAYKVTTLHNDHCPKFYGYWFDYIFDGRKYMFLSKNIRYSLTYDEFAALGIVSPPYAEQQAIADFLDKKCAEIDQMVALQEKFIEELKAYKQSLITETVTKGLNPNAPMKDSGVEWIGEIPEGWKVVRHKNIMHKIKEIQEVYAGQNILSLSTQGVIVRDLNAGGKMPVTFDGYQKVKKGNLLMCLFDMDVTPCCNGLILTDGVTSPAYSQFELCSDAYAPYYNLLFTALNTRKTLVHLSKNLRSSLTEDDFGLIPTILPPLSEQQAIADYLDKKCAEIDQLIAIKQKKADELKEYKKSIIYEYVTGKRSVCE